MSSLLKALQPVIEARPRSLIRAVNAELEVIESALGAGIRYEEIAQAMTAAGVPIKAKTLRECVYRVRRRKTLTGSNAARGSTQAPKATLDTIQLLAVQATGSSDVVAARELVTPTFEEAGTRTAEAAVDSQNWEARSPTHQSGEPPAPVPTAFTMAGAEPAEATPKDTVPATQWPADLAASDQRAKPQSLIPQAEHASKADAAASQATSASAPTSAPTSSPQPDFISNIRRRLPDLDQLAREFRSRGREADGGLQHAGAPGAETPGLTDPVGPAGPPSKAEFNRPVGATSLPSGSPANPSGRTTARPPSDPRAIAS